MTRFAVVFGLILVVMLAGACPRKIENIGSGGVTPNTPASRPNEKGDKDQNRTGSETGGDNEAGEGLETDAVPAGDGTGEPVEGSPDDASQPGDEPAEPDAVEAVDQPTADAEPSALEAEPEAATAENEVEPGPATDLEATEAEPFEEPSFTPQPLKVKLSREAVRFAGSWQAVVFDIGGESESATGERFVELSDAGSFEATALNRDGRLESGIWGMDGGVLSLSFGPAGEVEYTIDQPADNIAIWHGPSGGAMFCIRLPAETTALSPGEHYESGFGPLEFSRSGPGYWKGSYGDPEGSLVLQNAAQFLYGTWEQGKQSGYAILEFNQRGFEGFWWYSGQVSFGGEWNGEFVR